MMDKILPEIVNTPRELVERDLQDNPDFKDRFVNSPRDYENYMLLDSKKMHLFEIPYERMFTNESYYYMIRGKNLYTRDKVIITFAFNEDGSFLFKRYQKAVLSKVTLLRITREIYILSSLDHPQIIKLYKVIETLTELVLVFPYYQRGDLISYINSLGKGPLRYNLANKIMANLLEVVDYLHRNNIAHRDLKPDNILISDDDEIILTDFEFSTSAVYYNESSLGSFMYAAPELLAGQPYKAIEVDIFALGMIYFILLRGYDPFKRSPHMRYRDMFMGISPNYLVGIPSEIKIILMNMLNYIGEKRPLTHELLEYPVFCNYVKDQTPDLTPAKAQIIQKYNSGCVDEARLN